eukprot:6706445-Alexandrium_andersonii.AAC.1
MARPWLDQGWACQVGFSGGAFKSGPGGHPLGILDQLNLILRKVPSRALFARIWAIKVRACLKCLRAGCIA